MSDLASAGTGLPAPPALNPNLKKQQSLLFPSMFSQLNKDRRVNVLDVGPAQPETLHFFSPFYCRLHFAGMYSEPLVREGAGDLDGDALVREFSDLLAIPEGTRFDLCLLWDFPNYLDDRSLTAFSQALAPYLHPRSVGHGFAVRTQDTRIDNRWYGIDQPHLFTVRPPVDRQPRFHPHSQAILINLLTCFSIERGMLLPDGRLEVAMKSTV